MGMNKSNFLKTLEEKPLRMLPQAKLPRPDLVIHRTTPASKTSDSPVPTIVIVTLAFCLVYAFLRGVQV